MVYVYVIRSLINGRRYVGISSNVGARLRMHARKTTKGGQLLVRFELIHTEEFSSYSEARTREKFLKSGQGRVWLDAKFGKRDIKTDVDTRRPSPTVSRPSSGCSLAW